MVTCSVICIKNLRQLPLVRSCKHCLHVNNSGVGIMYAMKILQVMIFAPAKVTGIKMAGLFQYIYIRVFSGRCKFLQADKAKLNTQGSSLLKEKGYDYVVSLEAKMKACLSHL